MGTNEELTEEPEQTFTDNKQIIDDADIEGQQSHIAMDGELMHEQELEEDDDMDDDDEEEEEEFKVVLQTQNKQRLVLCTVEGVCCAMLQTPPFFDPNAAISTPQDSEQKTQD